jgi:flagellar motor protein MotB
MSRLKYVLLCAVMVAPAAGHANTGEERSLGEAVERHLPTETPFMQWTQDPERLAAESGDRLEKVEAVHSELETVKLSGLVPPVRFESGVADIPGSTVIALGEILGKMKHRRNVRLHLIGHADTQPLSPALAAIYGDNAGLSRERAGEVAEHFQSALALPPEGVSYEWAGDTQPVASNATEAGRSLNRRVEVEVWYDEVRERVALEEVLVPHEIKRVKVCRMETLCKLRYVEGHARRARVQNLIAPLHFGEESIDVDERFVESVRQALRDLGDKQNVVVRFVGYTDEEPLTGRFERIYGTPVGLSKARARRVALAVQDSLDLPTAVIDSDGRGAERPLASNDTARGRALNRRVEVEFWYDDPLQELPDELQLCPDSPGAELVTRVYDPPWGPIDHIEFSGGSPVVPDGYPERLKRAMGEIAGKTNVRLQFVGYTRNERLDRRTARVYGDDIGLSASRARRAMEAVDAKMQLAESEREFEGRGYVHSEDVVNAGFIQGDTSYVKVQVVYDELAVLDDLDGVDITRVSRELRPRNPLGLNLMRITVDGKPIDDPQRSSSDIQRCTDVAMKDADIRFGFDNLRSAPRLSVAASPGSLTIFPAEEGTAAAAIDTDTAHAETLEEIDLTRTALAIDTAGENDEGEGGIGAVRFRMYTNYSHFIERAEVRIFDEGKSLQSEPLDVVPIELDGIAAWRPAAGRFRAPTRELSYVLRAYGADGDFDETAPQPLWLVYADANAPAPEPGDANPVDEEALLVGWGENSLARQNIGLASGTVRVQGSGISADHEVWVAGRPVPVDARGSFVAEEILPQGVHTVEVAVLDQEGNGELYLRDLELESDDWFYVGMADLTLSANKTSGAMDSLSGENAPRDPDSTADGRVAFYVDGKFGDHWRLRASADTREGPLDDLFSNLMDKSPDSLFRRIDPDYYYPTFGDDGTVEELAPTMGKFFVRVSEQDNYGLWGNFKVGYMQNELAQVDRGLYGANLHYQSDEATSFGEQQFAVDLFTAEPGTIPGREEFRGTGGSLYFLRRQDVLPGSERVRVEVRDKASGLVTGVLNLTPSLDYDVDYLQGRIMLAEPLASTADDSLLVRSGALSGDEAYLVVRYEYTPGFEDLDALSTGGQVHYWIGEHVKLGLTANANEQDGDDSSLQAADMTFRMSAETWLKLQGATSEGLVSAAHYSNDGGFGFQGDDVSSFANVSADAYRADVSLSSNDFGFGNARLTLYVQDAEAGYSAPGLATFRDTTNVGGTLKVPVLDRLSLNAKADNRMQDQGLETGAQELNLSYRMSQSWEVSAGYRRDERTDRSPLVPLTQEQGERADAVVQVGYDSKADWSTYVFVQDTVSTTGDRPENGRVGAGGSYRFSERLRVNAEVSNGDLGEGGKLGTNYLYSERTSMYLNYTLENERTDNGLRPVRGNQGNLVAGIRSRLSDSTSVYQEERYQHTDTSTGLMHATGITLAPTERLNIGMNTDIGTLQDAFTGAETERRAAGLQFGYGFESLQLSSGIEYRHDDSEQLDETRSIRKTWLFRNSIKYQMTPSGRLIGKYNHADSVSSLGSFYDGGFTEAVVGYAYRPVYHDRLNALAKYTYFYNVPGAEQVTLTNTAAEFVQKSHIAALDVTYDLLPSLSIGGKYAYRLGQVSLDRESPEFFRNDASLYVLRGDWRFREAWELLAEGRMLAMPDLDERRNGALVAVSRYVGEHLKVGLGYNFTDFSDDLTDLDFNHQGLFLNLTGAM